MSHVTYQWVMSCMNESCHTWLSPVTYEWGMSHMNESCLIWMRHVKYEWVTSRDITETWLIRLCDTNRMTYSYVCHVTQRHHSFVFDMSDATCQIRMSDVSVWHDTHILLMSHFVWWVLQHCTGFARMVWGRLRVHRAFVWLDWLCTYCTGRVTVQYVGDSCTLHYESSLYHPKAKVVIFLNIMIMFQLL